MRSYAQIRLTRRKLLLGGVGAMLLSACSGGATIAELDTEGDVAKPGGPGVADPISVDYRLRRDAVVSIALQGPDGARWPLRAALPRTAGEAYRLEFDGTVPVGDDGSRRVLDSGTYQLDVVAVEPSGARDERTTTVRVDAVDAAPLQVEGPSLSVATITPDGDGIDDEVQIGYTLSKPATVGISAHNAVGERVTILPPTRRDTGTHTQPWDGSAGGRVFGGRRLPDGDYIVELMARDEAGNVQIREAPLRIANGGTERLEIVEASIQPARVRVGEQITVRMVIRNTGETEIRTSGPPPGTLYTTDQSFFTITDASGQSYEAQAGSWRVGLGWENAINGELPLRWGILPDPAATLAPGESAVVESPVTVLLSPNPGLRFWVGAIREGIGLISGRVGDQVIEILP